MTIDGIERDLKKRSNCLECTPYKTPSTPESTPPQKAIIDKDDDCAPDEIVFQRITDKYSFKVSKDGSIMLKTYEPITLSYNPNTDINVFKFDCKVNEYRGRKKAKPTTINDKIKSVEIKQLTTEQQDILDEYDNKLWNYDVLGNGDHPGIRPEFNS